MNKLSVSEQIENFFLKICLPIGNMERTAMRTRNIPAHGAFELHQDYRELHKMSYVYRCMINRIVLKLIGYEGEYVDYGKIGFPKKEINCPCGD